MAVDGVKWFLGEAGQASVAFYAVKATLSEAINCIVRDVIVWSFVCETCNNEIDNEAQFLGDDAIKLFLYKGK